MCVIHQGSYMTNHAADLSDLLHWNGRKDSLTTRSNNERKPADTISWLLFRLADRIVHATTFMTLIVERRLKRVAQWIDTRMFYIGTMPPPPPPPK